VLIKIRGRLFVCKKTAQKFNVERFNPKKLSGLELRKRFQIKLSIRYAALENLYESEDANRVWENMKETSKYQIKRV
jgi:hypothetical protein